MTHEMLRSDAPCAMALMLMLWRPSAPNTLPGDARPALHPVADHRENRLVGLLVEPASAARANSNRNSVLDRRRSPRAASALRTREADRVLGRGLRDQDDVDAPRGERPEQPLGDAGHADHAAPAQRQQRRVADRADALAPAARRRSRLREMQRARARPG